MWSAGLKAAQYLRYLSAEREPVNGLKPKRFFLSKGRGFLFFFLFTSFFECQSRVWRNQAKWVKQLRHNCGNSCVIWILTHCCFAPGKCWQKQMHVRFRQRLSWFSETHSRESAPWLWVNELSVFSDKIPALEAFRATAQWWASYSFSCHMGFFTVSCRGPWRRANVFCGIRRGWEKNPWSVAVTDQLKVLASFHASNAFVQVPQQRKSSIQPVSAISKFQSTLARWATHWKK